jgi:Uncharacterised protein family (UPF0182)
MDTYAQLQEIRTYYNFHDLDVDRYRLDGAYQSVMLSARELKSSLLPPNGADMGQPPRALHPRQRRGDEPGHPQERPRAVAFLLFIHCLARARAGPTHDASADYHLNDGMASLPPEKR